MGHVFISYSRRDTEETQQPFLLPVMIRETKILDEMRYQLAGPANIQPSHVFSIAPPVLTITLITSTP